MDVSKDQLYKKKLLDLKKLIGVYKGESGGRYAPYNNANLGLKRLKKLGVSDKDIDEIVTDPYNYKVREIRSWFDLKHPRAKLAHKKKTGTTKRKPKAKKTGTTKRKPKAQKIKTWQEYQKSHKGESGIRKKLPKMWKDYKEGKRANGGMVAVGIGRPKRRNTNALSDWRKFLETYKKKMGWTPSSKTPYKQFLKKAAAAYKR